MPYEDEDLYECSECEGSGNCSEPDCGEDCFVCAGDGLCTVCGGSGGID